MKKAFAVILSLCIVLGVFTACSSSTEGELFKDVTSYDIDGNETGSEVFKGKKLTMVNIWATFCSPCIKEMPDLQKLSVDYAEKDFQIIGIVSDVADINDLNKISEAKEIMKSTGVSYKNIVPSDSLNEAKLNSVYSVPETIFLDENGNQIGESYIGSRSYESWQAIIESLLAESNK